MRREHEGPRARCFRAWGRRARGFSLAACVLSSLGAARPPSPIERGAQLFLGELTLTARMVAHTDALPQQAARCANCHRPESTPTDSVSATDSAALATDKLGPALGPRALAQLVARRGGPPSSYDRRSFCRLLREGVDPAHVMIPQTMPRYTLTDEECEALWLFLTTR